MTKIESIFSLVSSKPYSEQSHHGLGSSHHSLGSSDTGDNPPVNWPVDPTIPPGGLDDPTLDPNWPEDGGIWGKITHSDPLQTLMAELTYIDAHPTSTQALIVFAKTVSRLQERGLVTGSIQAFLDQAKPLNINLMKDGIDRNAMYAFLYGYPDSSTIGQWSAVQNYITALQNQLEQIPHTAGDYIDGMLSETNFILGTSGSSTFKDQFMSAHSAGYNGTPIPDADVWGNPIEKGDIIWSYTDPVTHKTGYYDWSSAQRDLASGSPANADQDNETLRVINSIISNASGATGSSNMDISALDQILTKLQVQDALETFFSVLKLTGGDVGMAIMAFIFALEGDKMNQMSGSADVMDKQNKLSQDAKGIEDFLKGLTAQSTNTGDFRGLLQSLFTTISSSSQLGGLSDAVQSAITTLSTTMVPYPAGQTGDPTKFTTRSLWDLITDPTVPNVNAKDPNSSFSAAFNAMLFPTIDPTKSPPTSPGQFLQSLLGGVDGIVTAVTSSSTQANTTASQLQSLIQALEKVMTGVVDPNNGIDTAVKKTALNHQTGN